jgi:membrane-bound lytic murein transglycosylase D
MPMEIALLPMIESAFNPAALSPSAASGIWQFIPSTGRHYGLRQDSWYDGRRDFTAATNAALDYLGKLYLDFGDWQLALAAYNCGEGCIARAIQKNVQQGLPTDYASLSLPNETRQYVPKLLAIREPDPRRPRNARHRHRTPAESALFQPGHGPRQHGSAFRGAPGRHEQR